MPLLDMWQGHADGQKSGPTDFPQSSFATQDVAQQHTGPIVTLGLPDSSIPTPEGSQSQALSDFGLLPLTTRTLTEPLTGTTGTLKNMTTGLRQPIVIRGMRKPVTGPTPVKRHKLIQGVVMLLLLLIVGGSLFMALPAGSGKQGVLSLFKPDMNVISTHGNNTGMVSAQAATATVSASDGYQPGASLDNNVPPAIINGGQNNYPYGQCTWWANQYYHQLTGHWVTWSGNAYQWAAGASAQGWIVSATPHVPSIIVLQPGVQLASSAYGHVAVVTSINADGSVMSSNMNWPVGSGVRTVQFYPGAGVSFVWYRGA